MKRKIDEALRAWKASPNRKPLVVHGARQVGKTYSILEFAELEFDRVLYLDFSAQKDLSPLFDGDITPQALLPQLEAASGMDVDPKASLVFFDEVQACPRALTALKYFFERAPEYCVIAAGSLLGISLGRDDYAFPVGKVDALTLRPLDFEEFLWALGQDKLANLINSSYASDAPFPLHDRALELYRSYLLVGGMPEAVLAHVRGARLSEVGAIQRSIGDAYLADMTKYASPLDSSKILNVWRSVPEQLAKENHKFQYATIASSARAFQYEAPINWLHAAGLVTFCYRVSEGKKPLKAFVEHDFFKLYLLDVGILASLQGLDAEDVAPASDKGSRFRGGLAENYVMQQLLAAGLEPFYWGVTSRSEVDFIVQLQAQGAVPVEVKSGARVSSRSLESYRKAYEPAMLLQLSTKNFGLEGRIKSVPLYAAYCIGRPSSSERACAGADRSPSQGRRP